ncbi:MAG: regulatory protein RecX [Brevinematales bacterium]|nr:regulatory protein RecX [Brevinematales bacterium]
MKPGVEATIKRIERFLKFRPRTEKEIRFKLKGLKVPQSDIDESIIFLDSEGYINDTAFGYDWAESRIRSRKIGRNKLKNELKIKGISSEVIEDILRSAYTENDETELAVEFIGRKFRSGYSRDDFPRMKAMLSRNGYSFTIIDQVIGRLKTLLDEGEHYGEDNGS